MINLLSWPLYLLPAGIVSGPFVANLIVVSISLFFLFFSIKKKCWHYYKNKFFLFFLCFCVYIIFRSIFSEYPTFSLKSSLPYIRYGIFSLAIWYIIDKKKNFIENFFYFFCPIYLIIIFDGYFQYFFGYNIIGMVSPNDMRISGFFGDEIILGSFLWRMLPLFTALLFFKFGKTKHYEYFSVIVIFLVLVLAALSAERTSTAITLMFLFLHLFLIKKRKEFVIYPAIILIILTSILLLGDSYAKKRLITVTYQLSVGHYTLFFSKTHDSHSESAKKMFADNKFFGQGPNTFRKLCNKEQFYWDHLACSTHPHNTYIQFGAELGIVGLLFLFLAFIYLFINVFLQFIKIYFKKDSHKTNYQMYLIFGLFLFLWPIAPSGNFFSSWLSNIHFIPVGFYLHSISNFKKS